MKLTPYRKLLAMSKEALDAALAPVRARSAKKQAELEVCKIDEAIATQETKVTEHCSRQVVDYNGLISLLNELDVQKRRRRQFVKIIAELFPEDDAPVSV